MKIKNIITLVLIFLTFIIFYMGHTIHSYNKKIKTLSLEVEETYNHINSLYYLLNEIPLGSPLDTIK